MARIVAVVDVVAVVGSVVAALSEGGDTATAKPATPMVARCADQSGAGFPNAYTNPANLIVGPVAIVGGVGAGKLTAAVIEQDGRGSWKMPVLVRAGHTATITIRPSGRRDARLAYSHAVGGPPTIHNVPYDEVTFVACNEQRSQSSSDGEPVTFWSGGFVYRTVPVCVPLSIVIDRRAPVQRSLSLADHSCS